MSHLKQYMGNIISSANAPHGTFQPNTRRPASFSVCLSKHALGFALIWAISATSMAFAGEIATSKIIAGAPDRLVLSKPIISPSQIAPSPDKIRVTFSTSIAGISTQPTALALQKKLSNGEFSTVTELRDDGKEADTKAEDGIYSGMLELGSETETELYFRLSANYFGETVTSAAAVLPITTLMTRSRPSEGDLIITEDGQDKVYANEVILSTFDGVSPTTVKTMIKKVRDSLGRSLETINIVGYIPSLNAYLLEFKRNGSYKGKESLDGLKIVMESFKKYKEIVESVSPNEQITPTAATTGKWYLDKIGIDILRESVGLRAGVTPPPVFGLESIGVGILDKGVNCDSSLLNINTNCAPPSSLSVCPPPNRAHWHGTRVAALVAGMGASDGDVAEGVAWKTTLFPLWVGNSIHNLIAALECAPTLNQNGSNIHILNASLEVSGREELQNAVCHALCNNLLLVASAGNGACDGPRMRYPASYNDKDPSSGLPLLKCETPRHACDMEYPAITKRILKVGGLDRSGKPGDTCRVDELKSQEGEIWAPGWGMPAPPARVAPNGTSWPTALVSGCAAVHAAFQKWAWKHDHPTERWTWDPVDVHDKLTGKAHLVNGRYHLNCSAGERR